MAQQIDPKVLSALAKIDTTGMKHTQKLDAFAKALGHKSQTAMMGACKAAKKAEKQQAKTPAFVPLLSLDGKVARLYEQAFRARKDGPQDPFPRQDWAYEVDNDDTNLGREDWWESKMTQFLEDDCGVEDALRRAEIGDIKPEHAAFILGGPHDVEHFAADEIFGEGFVDAWAVLVRDYAGMTPDDRKAATDRIRLQIQTAETVPVEERVNVKIRDLADNLLRLAGKAETNNLPGEPVWAEMWSDDRIVEVTVDVRPFLAKMTASDYAGLRAEGFGPGNASDAAFYAMEKTDADAASLSAYLAAVNGGRVEVGFSVRIDAEAAEAWVADHRPDIWGDPILVAVETIDGSALEVDIRPALAGADDEIVGAVLAGDANRLQDSGYAVLSEARSIHLYTADRETVRDWVSACRPAVLTPEDRPGL